MTGSCLFCQTEFKKREVKYKFCSVTCSSRYNRNRLKKISLPPHSEELAEFIGICLGDGTTSRYQTSVTLNASADKDYIPYVLSLATALFPEAHISQVERKDNAVDLKINSCVVSAFMRSMGIVPNKKFIPLWIQGSLDYRKACVRGLFDTEGSISFKQYQRKKSTSIYSQLNFRNTNRNLLRLVKDTLLELQLKPTLSLKASLYISNREGIRIVKEQIGFNNPKLQRRSKITEWKDYKKYYYKLP